MQIRRRFGGRWGVGPARKLRPVSVRVTPSLSLASPVSDLPGVGPSRLTALHALGIRTLCDLLLYYPRDYQYVSAQAPIRELQPNTIATATGEVVAVSYIAAGGGGRGRPRFEATLDDGTGKLALTFFHGGYLRTKIHPGLHLKVQGKLRMFRNLPQMQNPKWTVIQPPTSSPNTGVLSVQPAAAKLVPVYAATAAMPSDVIGRLIETAMPLLLPLVPETLPEALRSRRDLLPKQDALRAIHRPESKLQAIAARKRLVYDELIQLQLGLLLSREQAARSPVAGSAEGGGGAARLVCDRTLDQRIRARFPFTLTDAQTHVIYDILRDFQSGRPMNRLLQGDVGSGKTAVALYAMLVAVANRMQAALLAPTEVLAEQHYLSLSRFMAGSSVVVELITSRTKRLSKGAVTRALADGRVHIAVGTQALLQDDIRFANLGLVVVDEQHRLGVQQRATLRDKVGDGATPHYLVMTATPIPRTLALSYFADFDLSVIDHLPPGRTPIQTRVVPARDEPRAWAFLREQIAEGRQAYVVVPQIGDSPPDDAEADESLREDLRQLTTAHKALTAAKGPLHGLRVETLHGQMDAEQKQAVMERFRCGEADVLLATTVIEVGIDVPNATVIAILSAERFGLSQLHQLRGRVGRGEHASYCLLFPSAPSPGTGGTGGVTEESLARLQALASTTSGFAIAELDLRLRGPGQFFGTRQHGLPEFRLADLSSESELLEAARDDARWMLQRDPKLASEPFRPLRGEVIRQFAHLLPLATVG